MAQLDAKKKQYAAVCAEVGEFADAPFHIRSILVAGITAALISTYGLYFYSATLFQEFAITVLFGGLNSAALPPFLPSSSCPVRVPYVSLLCRSQVRHRARLSGRTVLIYLASRAPITSSLRSA